MWQDSLIGILIVGSVGPGAASVLRVGGVRRSWSSSHLETRTTHSKVLSAQGTPELGKQKNRHEEASFSKHSGKARLSRDIPVTLKTKCEKERCVSLVL